MVRAFILVLSVLPAFNVAASEEDPTIQMPFRSPDIDAIEKPLNRWMRVPFTTRYDYQVCNKYEGKTKIDCLLTLHDMNYIPSEKLKEGGHI